MASVDIKSWDCNKCTFLNGGHLATCVMCGATKPIREKSVSSHWTCTACTMVNNGSQGKCKVCYANRTTEQWLCPFCYYWNVKGTKNCAKCHHIQVVTDKDNRKGKKNLFERMFSKDDLDLPHDVKKGSDVKDFFSKIAGDLKIWKQNDNDTKDVSDKKKSSDVPVGKKSKGEDFKDFRTKDIQKTNDGGGARSNEPVNVNKNIWSCKWCTFYNKLESSMCEMCSLPRPPSDKKSPANKSLRKRQLHNDCRTMKVVDMRQKEEKEAKLKYDSIIEHCKKSGSSFEDHRFPPVLKSLYYNPWPGSKNPKWLRCCNVHSDDSIKHKEWVVYRSPTSPEDICQGSLGNCWYISAMAVLAYREDLLEKIIVTKSFCPQGAYMVRLCKDGYWKIILVDDLFPCDQYNRLMYSKTKRRQLWVPLIEKAAAKLHGCYEALTSGRTVEALSLLTGEPCERIDLQETDTKIPVNEERIWRKLLNARRSKYLMGTSCGSSSNKTVDQGYYKSQGLVALHAYSLLDVQDVEGNQLVQIRNPWGYESWKGAWCDSSPKWKEISSNSRSKIKTDGNKKGIFWMAFKDFIRYFDSVDVCKVRPDWQESRHKGTFPCHSGYPWKFFKLAIIGKTEVTLGLFQKNLRGLKDRNEDLVDLLIVVLEDNDDGKSFKRVIKHSYRVMRSFVGCDVELNPGKYTVACLAFKHWKTTGTATFREELAFNKDFVLTIHSSGLVITEEVDTTSGYFKYLLADTVIQLALNKGSPDSQNLYPDLKAYSLGWCGDIVVVENNSSKKYGHIMCDYTKSSHLLTSRGDLRTFDSIPPKHRQVIAVLSPQDSRHGWKYSRQLKSIQSSDKHLPKDWGIGSGLQHLPLISTQLAGLHDPRPC